MKPPQIDLNPLYMAITRDVLSRFASTSDLVVVRDAAWDQYHQRSKISGSESENDIMIDMKPPKINLNPLYMAISNSSRCTEQIRLFPLPRGDATWG